MRIYIFGGDGVHAADPQEHLQFKRTPTEVTYSKLTNSKKPNKGGQHLEKKQRGANILEVKYQKGDLQKVFY